MDDREHHGGGSNELAPIEPGCRGFQGRRWRRWPRPPKPERITIFDPISSICRAISRNFIRRRQGGAQDLPKKKRPSSKTRTHSEEPVFDQKPALEPPERTWAQPTTRTAV